MEMVYFIVKRKKTYKENGMNKMPHTSSCSVLLPKGQIKAVFVFISSLFVIACVFVQLI